LEHHLTSDHGVPESLDVLQTVEILYQLGLEYEARTVSPDSNLASARSRDEEVIKGAPTSGRNYDGVIWSHHSPVDAGVRATGFDNGPIDYIIPSLRKIDDIDDVLRVSPQLLDRARTIPEGTGSIPFARMEREIRRASHILEDHSVKALDEFKLPASEFRPPKYSPQNGWSPAAYPISWRTSHDKSTLPLLPKNHKLNSLINLVSFYIRDRPLQDCSLFFGKDGMLGLAPTSIMIGDLICLFKKSNIVAIVRKTGQDNYGYDKYTVIGRAISLLPTEGNPGMLTYIRPTISLQLDLTTIQALTRTTPVN
jgi:hypothetical protein